MGTDSFPNADILTSNLTSFVEPYENKTIIPKATASFVKYGGYQCLRPEVASSYSSHVYEGVTWPFD